MECTVIESEITNFYFGSISTERRNVCENHILSCEHCLKEFLQLKRHIELEPAPFELPSANVQERIRRKVSEKIRDAKIIAIYPLRNRLFQGMAVAASVAAIWVGITGYRNATLFQKPTVEEQMRSEIDTARDNAVSLNML